MAQKILLLNSSPQKNGNVFILCDHFAEGAKKSGNEIYRFNVSMMDIHGCMACYKGGGDIDKPCVIHDDMDKIYPFFNKCDIVVLASPMFLWNFSSQLKATLDRLFGIFECYKDYAIPFKKCILLMVAQESYESNWKLFMDWYEKYINNMGWLDIGKLTTGGFLKPGDISGSPILDEAYKLGESIA